MKAANPIFKYVLASVVLLGTFLFGYHFKQWYAAKYRIQKQIAVVYSSPEDEISRESFEKSLVREFRAQGVEPVLDKFYLDSNHFEQQDATDDVWKYLEIIKTKSIDLILVVSDQAALSLLSTRHHLLDSTPVVACNVHFPDEKLISEYESRKVYVLRDRPDFPRNMEFIKSLRPQTDMEIVYNIDLTPLGRKSFDLLSKSIDRKSVQVLGTDSAFPMACEYNEIRQMTEYYDLMPALANGRKRSGELTVSLYPFRYIKGISLLDMMEHSKGDQEKKAFLLDKFDMMALPIVNALSIPSFSCIREGFSNNSKIIGGYMATDELSARAAAELAVRLLNKEKVGMPKIRDLGKEYVINWHSFSAYGGYDIGNVPNHVRIVNYRSTTITERNYTFWARCLFWHSSIYRSVCCTRAGMRRSNARICKYSKRLTSG